MNQNPSLPEIVARIQASPPRLGNTRLTVIDGPAASGKTTVSHKIAEAVGANLFHVDELLEGWSGLSRLWPRLREEVLEPISIGRPGVFRVWDWDLDQLGQLSEVPVSEFLVIEGVGIGHREVDQFASLKIWVEAPKDLRIKRGLQRDGEEAADLWNRWIPEETALHEAHSTRDRSDILIDGTSPLLD